MSVLPVILVPADRKYLVPNPDQPTQSLAGAPIDANDKAEYDAATNNIVVALQVVQQWYHRQLRHPNPEFNGGTFQLATWDRDQGNAEVFVDGFNELEPLVYPSDYTLAQLDDKLNQPAELVDRSPLVHVMQAAGCTHQTSCPFIFAIFVAQEDIECPKCSGPLGGRCTCPRAPMNVPAGDGAVAANYGFDGGLGFGLFGFRRPKYQGSGSMDFNLNGLLMHELGHAFGLSHVWEVYTPDSDLLAEELDVPVIDWGSYTEQVCAERYADPDDAPLRKYGMLCSTSVMSYSARTGADADKSDFAAIPEVLVAGCLEETVVAGKVHCLVPSDPAEVDRLEGELIPENIRNLSINRRVFPDLVFEERAHLPPGDPLLTHPGPGQGPVNDLPGMTRFDVTATGTLAGMPHQVFGWGSNAFAQHWASFDPWRMWLGEAAGASVHIRFPSVVDVDRVRVYLPAADGLQAVHVGGRMGNGAFTTCGVAPFLGINTELLIDCPSSDEYAFTFSGTEDVAVRGIRLWEGALEYAPAREPRAWIVSGGLQSGSVDHVVGTDAEIGTSLAPFDPTNGYKSSNVGEGGWSTIEVEFPDDLDLAGLMVHSGYLLGQDSTRRVLVSVRNEMGSFEHVADLLVEDGSFAPLPSTIRGRVWRLEFEAGPSGVVAIRSVRFLSAPWLEQFPPADAG